jgi:hypothetical protein
MKLSNFKTSGIRKIAQKHLFWKYFNEFSPFEKFKEILNIANLQFMRILEFEKWLMTFFQNFWIGFSPLQTFKQIKNFLNFHFRIFGSFQIIHVNILIKGFLIILKKNSNPTQCQKQAAKHVKTMIFHIWKIKSVYTLLKFPGQCRINLRAQAPDLQN